MSSNNHNKQLKFIFSSSLSGSSTNLLEKTIVTPLTKHQISPNKQKGLPNQNQLSELIDPLIFAATREPLLATLRLSLLDIVSDDANA